MKTRDDFSFFSESQSRIIVSISKENQSTFEKFLNDKKQSFCLMGKTGGNKFVVKEKISINLTDLSEIYFNTIPEFMNGKK